MNFHCPTCHKPAAIRAENPAFPFCSARCRSIDLGAWLTENYRIPAESAELSGDVEVAVGGDNTDPALARKSWEDVPN